MKLTAIDYITVTHNSLWFKCEQDFSDICKVLQREILQILDHFWGLTFYIVICYSSSSQKLYPDILNIVQREV